MNKKAIILVNVGTPDKPERKFVKRFLSSFLNDKRVIDLPYLLRKFLVNIIIIPFRVRKSTNIYKLLWTPKGSPLLIFHENLSRKLQAKIPEHTKVYAAMRYGAPSMKKLLDDIHTENFDEIVVFPLFPQYASSTTGTIIEYVMNIAKKWEVIPAIKFMKQFYYSPHFIRAFAHNIRQYNPDNYDFILFSYHGLPNRHLQKTHTGVEIETCTCEKSMPQHGKHCYKACCYETTRLLVKELNIPEGRYATSFQSRLSKNWMKPFSDDTIIELAKKGIKKILMVAPAFVADCLETTIEIGVEYRALFKKHGGEDLVLVESLNDSDIWADAVMKLLQNTAALREPD